MQKLRIAQVVPPIERVPPLAYGGTERVVDALCAVLADRGHSLTVFASGDSIVPGQLVPTVPRALRPDGFGGDSSPYMLSTLQAVLQRAREFDVIHSHLESWSGLLARVSPMPVVSTFHGRLDLPWLAPLLVDLGTDRSDVTSAPNRLVAISAHQASAQSHLPWSVVHNGLDLTRLPFIESPGEEFCFVGRVDPEKGIVEAIEIARLAERPLRIAAKVGTAPHQRAYYEDVFRPALDKAGSSVDYLGELSPSERDRLFAESCATLMPGSWPEPFGLVAIESLACGTPVLARRVGGLPEVIREGRDGWFGDDIKHLAFLADRIADLDRAEIRASVLERFSAARMTASYEALYAEVITAARGSRQELSTNGHGPSTRAARAPGGPRAARQEPALQASRRR